MDRGIAQRVTMVTGASSGLGRRFAEVLAREGARVVLAARRRERLLALQEAIRTAGGEAHALALDVADVTAIREAAAEVERQFGPIAILVNNAGISRQRRLEEVDEDDWDAVLDTNLKGAFFLAQAAARQMIRHGIGGRIINIGSIAGERTVGQQGPYAISKAGVAHMTRCMAREWGRYGINTNAIAPGYIATEMAAEFLATEAGLRLVQSLPRRRMGAPEDLDGLLLLLCSDAPARFINGAVMGVDDGALAG